MSSFLLNLLQAAVPALTGGNAGAAPANSATPPTFPDPNNKTADPYRSTPKPPAAQPQRNAPDPTFGGARPEATAPSAAPPAAAQAPQTASPYATPATPPAAPPAAPGAPQAPSYQVPPAPVYKAPSFWQRAANIGEAAAGGALSPKDQGGQMGATARAWEAKDAAAKQAPIDYQKNLPSLRESIYQNYLKDTQSVAATQHDNAETDLEKAEAEKDRRPPEAKEPTTPEAQAIHDLMTGGDNGTPRINPTTKQPYSYLDAYTAVKTAGQKPEGEKTGAEKPEIEAQIGAKPTGNVYAGKTYKTPAEALAAWGKAYEDGINREGAAAAGQRGGAYAAGRLAGPIDVLDTFNGNRPTVISVGEAEQNPERYLPQNATTAGALKGTATLEDIKAGIDQTRALTGELDKGFDNRAAIAGAMIDSGGKAGQFLLGELDRGHLTQSQYEYVDSINSLIERAMTLRGVGGMGAGSDELRRAIVAALPGPGTPNKAQALDKLKRVEDVANRLFKGVPKVPLRNDTETGGENKPQPTQGAAPSGNPNDRLGIF